MNWILIEDEKVKVAKGIYGLEFFRKILIDLDSNQFYGALLSLSSAELSPNVIIILENNWQRLLLKLSLSDNISHNKGY